MEVGAPEGYNPPQPIIDYLDAVQVQSDSIEHTTADVLHKLSTYGMGIFLNRSINSQVLINPSLDNIFTEGSHMLQAFYGAIERFPAMDACLNYLRLGRLAAGLAQANDRRTILSFEIPFDHIHELTERLGYHNYICCVTYEAAKYDHKRPQLLAGNKMRVINIPTSMYRPLPFADGRPPLIDADETVTDFEALYTDGMTPALGLPPVLTPEKLLDTPILMGKPPQIEGTQGEEDSEITQTGTSVEYDSEELLGHDTQIIDNLQP